MQSRKTPNKKAPQNNSPIGGFKIYWIYGIIAIIFLGLQLTSINPSENITETEFLNKVENNDVKSVTFVTNAGYAEVELINNASNTPKLHFRYSDIKDVKEQIRLKNSDDYQIIIDSREENRMFGEILSWIFPLVLFIGIWILIMRRMGGGAGGGGGQIFNIGKSKAQMFGQGKDYYPGPVSNPAVYSASHVEYNYVWKVTKAEIDEFILWYDCGQTPGCTQNSSYVIPDVIINWPGTGENWNGQSQYIAPFIDVNQNGIYNPLDGDYPCIKGDMALFTVFNDDGVHTETGGEPLKMEIRALHYGYNSSDSALANTVFSEYTVINYAATTYSDFYIGIWEDMDIGCSEDDYVGCDVERNLAYTFNADSVDNDGCNGVLNYGYNPPAQGLVVLRGLSQDNDGVANQIGIGQNEVINGCGYGDNIPDMRSDSSIGNNISHLKDKLIASEISISIKNIKNETVKRRVIQHLYNAAASIGFGSGLNKEEKELMQQSGMGQSNKMKSNFIGGLHVKVY